MKAIPSSTVQRLVLATSILVLGSACACPLLTELNDAEFATGVTVTTSATATTASTQPSPPTPTPPAPGTLIVRSFPSDQKVYVVPEKAAQGVVGSANLTAEEYFAGHTPLEVSIEPGTYRVTIEHEPARLLNDGESETIFLFTEESDEDRFTPMAKIYDITKAPDRQAIVTALIWPEEQSPEEFVATLPEEELFEVSRESFEPVLQRHHIPREDWGLLLTMLRKTGKAVWYGQDRSDHLFIYFVAPDRMDARWGGAATP
jgi:hypothetical protein